MSLATMRRVRAYLSLKGAEKLVLLGIADAANDDGIGWIKVADLATWASIEPRSVTRILARLERMGYIQRQVGMGGFKDHKEAVRPSLYTILDEPDQHENLSTGATGGSPLPPDPRVAPPPDPTVGSPPDPRVGSLYNDYSTSIQPPLPPTGGARGFDQIFAAYPRQTARFKAWRFWEQLQPDDATRQAMLTAISEWRADPAWQREGGRYIPQLWKWLRDRRWEDVPGIAPAPRPKPMPEEPSKPVGPPSASTRAAIRELLSAARREPRQVEAA